MYSVILPLEVQHFAPLNMFYGIDGIYHLVKIHNCFIIQLLFSSQLQLLEGHCMFNQALIL